MAGRACAVVGGGPIAAGKVQALVDAGARVTVIAPALTEPLRLLADAGHVAHVARDYQPGDLAGAAVAFAATGDARVTEAVVTEARRRGVLVNAADDPARCDFTLPSVLRRGALVVAVGTGGASPALARAIRRELEEYFGDEYAALVELVGGVRRELRERAVPVLPGVWNRALDRDLRHLVADGHHAEARRTLLDRLGVPSEGGFAPLPNLPPGPDCAGEAGARRG